ncbi:hypothetical protein ACIBHX_44980 [Nonomuraea sp. NPDC050536]|uniref:hypothetical protein n=1 Tax=Nonomuraea sp. NPDC050536 TaxID=3364366 RepID=UPI0037CCAE19
MTWADFLRSQAGALLACDVIEAVTLNGQRQYILAVIEHAARRVRVLGTTAHPTATWVIQAIKNLVMDVEDGGCRARFLIRDRDGKFPALMGEILAGAGIQTVFTGIRMPWMNSMMERWVQFCRRKLLDRCLLWKEHHLRHALREYERVLQPAPSALRPGSSGAATLRSESDHGYRANHRPEHTPKGSTRRSSPRVLTCSLKCVDGLFGRRSPEGVPTCGLTWPDD